MPVLSVFAMHEQVGSRCFLVVVSARVLHSFAVLLDVTCAEDPGEQSCQGCTVCLWPSWGSELVAICLAR